MTEGPLFPKHTLIRFYIPLNRPMPIPYGPYYLYEHKSAAWLSEFIPHPHSDIEEDVTQRGMSFVQVRWMHREGSTPIIDFSLSDDAIDLATHELKASDLPHEPEEQAQQFQSMQWGPVTTVMVATTPMLLESGMDVEQGLNIAFDRILETARRWETGYRIESSDLLFPLTSRPSMAPVVPWTYLNVEDTEAEWAHIGLFFANVGSAHVASPSEYVEPEQINRIGTRYQRSLANDPFMLFSSLSNLAFRLHSLEGDFSSAAIQSYSSGEVLLEGLFQSVAWESMTSGSEDSISYEEILQAYFDAKRRPRNISYRLFTSLPKLLHGWPQRDQNCPLTEWRMKAGRLRNRIVHSGYSPSEQESMSVINATREMEQSIKDILLQKTNLMRLPKTVFFLMGIEGLKKRSLYDGEIKSYIESHMDESWLSDFADFRERLDQEVWCIE